MRKQEKVFEEYWMTQVTLYIAASLDGYIADITGGVSWLESYNEDYPNGLLQVHYKKSMGRA